MQQVQQQNTTGSQVGEGFNQFISKIKAKRKYSNGQYKLVWLPFKNQVIDIQARSSNWLLGKLSGFLSTSLRRPFLLYLPQSKGENFGLIFLLHGTNQTMFNSELTIQQNGQTGWFDYADKNGYALVFAQSRGLKVKNKIYYGWQPGNEDLTYLLSILQNLKIYKQILQNDIVLIGFSNGGLFISDLYLNYLSCAKSLFKVKVFVNYMGGIEYSNPIQSFKFYPKQLECPIIIMSCPKEQNYSPCYRAYKLFQKLKCNVQFVNVDINRHEFTSQMVGIIANFIKN